eukprot:1055323-Pelagomonas_calceolata.AAC.4
MEQHITPNFQDIENVQCCALGSQENRRSKPPGSTIGGRYTKVGCCTEEASYTGNAMDNTIGQCNRALHRWQAKVGCCTVQAIHICSRMVWCLMQSAFLYGAYLLLSRQVLKSRCSLLGALGCCNCMMCGGLAGDEAL